MQKKSPKIENFFKNISLPQSAHSNALWIRHSMGDKHKQWIARTKSSNMANCSTRNSKTSRTWMCPSCYHFTTLSNVSMGICWQPEWLLFCWHCKWKWSGNNSAVKVHPACHENCTIDGFAIHKSFACCKDAFLLMTIKNINFPFNRATWVWKVRTWSWHFNLSTHYKIFMASSQHSASAGLIHITWQTQIQRRMLLLSLQKSSKCSHWISSKKCLQPDNSNLFIDSKSEGAQLLLFKQCQAFRTFYFIFMRDILKITKLLLCKLIKIENYH